jgi:hypothetical protein
MKIRLTNDFHRTETTVNTKEENGRHYLTLNQVQAAEKKLCGMADCQCSGILGIRGEQPDVAGFDGYATRGDLFRIDIRKND